MSAPSLSVDKTGDIQVAGDLTLHTVASLIKPGHEAIAQAQGQVVVDLAAVSRFSSAGVALILNWLRAAEAHKVSLMIKNPPADLPAIIEVCDLDAVFEPVLSGSDLPE